MCSIRCTDAGNRSLLIFGRDRVEPRLDSFHDKTFEPKLRYFYPPLFDKGMHINSSLSPPKLSRGRRGRVSVCTITVLWWVKGDRELSRAQQRQVLCTPLSGILHSSCQLCFLTMLLCLSRISWNSSAESGELCSCLARWRGIFWGEMGLLLFRLHPSLTSCAHTQTQTQMQTPQEFYKEYIWIRSREQSPAPWHVISLLDYCIVSAAGHTNRYTHIVAFF